MSERGIAPGLLIAMPQLQDPNFERAVVLMVEHTENGSFGLIVNRPGELDLTAVLDSLEVEWHGDPEAVVWTGGPVMPRTGWLLHEPVPLPGDEGTLQVAPGVALSTSPERLEAIASAPPRRVRFLMGYSGWGPKQLESELASGAWLHAEAAPELVFDTPAEEMWERALRSLGIEPTTLVPASGIH